ncbi:MAG TPA: type I restriction endonuclease [Hyphomicrobiales bacterium]|nr:type I restriction endonuclease [Hyphomicrobiales bacterium]
MEIYERLDAYAKKVEQQGAMIQTEEATKNAFIMPFISAVLGYDVFNPLEVTPELVADIGTKKGEKIDYAILKDGNVQMLIECKKVGEPLRFNHASQLYRYFSVTSARIAILTNGQHFWFYTDLDAPNRMDEKPFLVLDVLDIDDHVVPELSKITKQAFDIDSIMSAAEELKYVSQLKKLIASQIASPDDDFVKLFASRVYGGSITPRVREQFSALVVKAGRQFVNDQINGRLKSAISPGTRVPPAGQPQEMPAAISEPEQDRVNTTMEEIEGFHIVRAILRQAVDIKRIHSRDTQSYFGVLLDDNNRKPICRLHFNRSQKYLGVMGGNKVETRHPIQSLDDIFLYADDLIRTATSYDTSPNEGAPELLEPPAAT